MGKTYGRPKNANKIQSAISIVYSIINERMHFLKTLNIHKTKQYSTLKLIRNLAKQYALKTYKAF